jgi:CBS domain-containing protein
MNRVEAEEASMIARDLMTPDPLTVTPKSTVAEAWDVMRDLAVRHVPVVDRGALVGMLSDRDLAQVDMVRLLRVEGADALREELETPIVEIMSSDVISVEPDTEMSDVISLLLEHKIGAVPVVEPGTREVLGIISYVDLLRALQDLIDED